MASSIDVFDFVQLDTPPNLPQYQLATRTRPGSDGVAVQRLGRWASAFEIQSLALCTDVLQGLTFYEAYCSIVGTGVVQVTWANIPYALTGVAFHVLAVELVENRPVLTGLYAGGTFGATLRCKWRLQPVTP